MFDVFSDRQQAGEQLADAIQKKVRPDSDNLVLALPRGGVPVAFPVAQTLDAELDLLLVRKLGLPEHEELAMGAIASGGIRVINDDVIAHSGVTQAQIEQVAAQESRELERREHTYRGDRPTPTLRGRSVFLVDDGVATGATMLAAVDAVRSQQPGQLIVAVPVAPPSTVRKLEQKVDQVVCLREPEAFNAIGQWYRNFGQTSDDEVKAILARAWQAEPL